MNRNRLSWLLLPLIAGIVVALDQWSKGFVERTIPIGSMWAPIPAIEPYFKFTHLTNSGAAFGILQGQAGLFVVIAIVVIVGMLVYARFLPTDGWGVRACLGLQLGGAIGNLTDRIQHNGHVTDFALLTLPWRGGELQWPAFNVADSAIVVGVIILAFFLLTSDQSPAPAQPAAVEPTAVDTADQG